MSEETRVRHEWLRQTCNAIQIGFGVADDQAETVTDLLVEANLMGIDTHGVIRLKLYMDRIREGGNNAKPNIQRIKDAPCTALIDADNALGPVGGKMGMDLAIEKAAANGVAMVLVRNSNHYGPAGYYARMALPHDMIGVSLCNTLASMPPTGGAEGRVGNNPYAVGIIAGEEPPVVVDGATSKSSWGKVFLCAQKGEPLPADCYLDSEGNVTLDPEDIMSGGGCLLPFAGHKGYGIASAIALLTGMLADATVDHEIPHPYKFLDKPGVNSYLFGAVRIDHFTDVEGFKKRMDEWIRLVRNTRKAPGVDRIWLPGEKEAV
ncbi:MAG: Ldh family oxidoreductase, partial [Planctomycetes bacterium]|nr:Ldh family oxidoreductase [Planctomycetota bacterium]